jgi:hypothetical protein
MKGIEIVLILILIGWQVVVFLHNRIIIRRAAEMYPPVDRLSIATVSSSGSAQFSDLDKIKRQLVTFTWSENPGGEFILEDNAASEFAILRWDSTKQQWEAFGKVEKKEVAAWFSTGNVQISSDLSEEIEYDALVIAEGSIEFKRIQADTNDYLRNNKGAAADFNILKDISEREAESLDEEIQAQVSTPLYLGLLGTFAGAILGLVALVNPFDSNSNVGESFSNTDVSNFLGGILIAMGGSLIGLALTLFGNQLLKKAHATRNRHKNSYYNFLQKALLPKLNSDMQSSMSNLKSVLDTFNQDFFSKIQQDFFSKISEFTPLISSITANISVQKNFLEKLQTIGYTQLANSTIKVFDRVEESAATFEKFLGYQQVLNKTVLNSTDMAQSINSLLNRLSSLEKGLLEVPNYLKQHDDNIRSQVAFFGEHNQLLKDLGGKIRENVDDDTGKIREIMRQRINILDREAQSAHEEWYQHFQRLNENNVYERIVEYLDPFKDMAAQQRELNTLQEKQAKLSARALEKLEQRLVTDSAIQERLILQAERTNKVLENTNEMLREMNGRSWVERVFGNKKKVAANGGQLRKAVEHSQAKDQPPVAVESIVEIRDVQSE